MGLIDEVIASITEDARVEDVCVGVFFTLVKSKASGLASTFAGPHPFHRTARDAGTYRGRPVGELMSLLRSDSPVEASIGMAAVNSMLTPDPSLLTEENAVELLLRRGSGRKMAIVGHFPWIPRLRQEASELWVIEQDPRQGDLPPDAADEVIPRAEVVGITGTSVMNHTIDRLLALASKAFVVLIGPSSPLSPVLFDYGVDAIAGSLVVDHDMALRYVAEGAIFPQVQGVQLVTMRPPWVRN
jgi:hypothetical protein